MDTVTVTATIVIIVTVFSKTSEKWESKSSSQNIVSVLPFVPFGHIEFSKALSNAQL